MANGPRKYHVLVVMRLNKNNARVNCELQSSVCVTGLFKALIQKSQSLSGFNPFYRDSVDAKESPITRTVCKKALQKSRGHMLTKQLCLK